MTNIKATKRALGSSVLALFLCFAMLLGTTFAWFTDSVTSANNIITAGNLDVELYWTTTPDEDTSWVKVDENTNVFKTGTLWEPGHTEVVYLKVVNEGTLALKYQLGVNVASEVYSTNVYNEPLKLSDHIKYGIADYTAKYADAANAIAAVDADATALSKAWNSGTVELAKGAEKVVAMVVYMPETVGNEANYAKDAPQAQINLGINLFATQVAAEEDSFGPDYDTDAPIVSVPVTLPTDPAKVGDITLNSTINSENEASVEVKVELPKNVVENIISGNPNIEEIALSISKPVVDATTKTVTFDSIEIVDQDGEIVELSNLNLEAELVVTLPVNGAFAEGETVVIYHDGTAVASATVTGGFISYEVAHFCEVEVVYTNKVTNAHELMAAIANVSNGGTITLENNIVFDKTSRVNNGGSWYEGLYYNGDKSFTIDLNGYKITNDDSVNDYLIYLKNDGSRPNVITFKNGTIEAAPSAYAAIATSSTNAQTITINLENVNVIGDNENGAVIKARGGAVLNVKDGTVVTGKDNYVCIESVGNNTVTNIYEGTEFYQKGTSNYVGALIGASYNSTVNVYGGYGKSAKGGFIVMTSGGTINVYDGEWIANTDGTPSNDNLGVLIAQNDKNTYPDAGKSVVNVYGGTFKGGYNCYAVAAGEAALNIKAGNFNADPAKYVVDGYKALKSNGLYYVVDEKYDYAVSTVEELKEAIKVKNATVLVLSGTYDMGGNFNIAEGATVIGDGEVTLNGTLTSTLKNVKVTGITFESGNAQRWAYASGEVYFEDCTFNATSVYAIHYDGTTGADITYKNCTIIGWVAIGGTQNSLVFDGCEIYGNGTYGVIRVYADTTIKNCTFDVANVNTTDVYQDGIHAVDCVVTVENCTNVNGTVADLLNVSGTGVITVDGYVIVDTIAELETAIANGYKVIFGADITGDITVTQAPDTKVVINGNGYKLNGIITVDGKSATYTTSAVTIKNVNFVAESISADACIRLGNGTNATRYTCNVTVENCTFDVPGAVGVKSYTGGDKNVTIKGCTATANAHSLAQLKGVDGVLVDGCEVYSKNGINFNNSTNVTVKNSTVDVKGYAVRFGESSGGVGAAETYTITNCTLKSACDDDDAVIVLRGTADNATLKVVKTTIEGAIELTNTAKGAKVYLDGALLVSDTTELQAAINSGESNILLGKGEYTADLYNINARDSLTITGQGADTKIKFANLQVRASQFKNLTIDNCTIERMPDKAWGHLVFGSSATAGGKYTISNCIFNGVGSQGIFINQTVEATFNIENCTFNGDFGGEGAITIQNNDGVVITVNVTGCDFNNIPATSHEMFLHYAYDGLTLNADGVNVCWKVNQ